MADKNSDIKKLVIATFEGADIKPETLDLIRQWQAVSKTLTDIDRMDLQSMVEYYEGKENDREL